MRWAIVTVAVLGIGITAAVWSGVGRTASGPQEPLATATLVVDGMDCGGCALSVKMAAKEVTGVASAEVSLETGTAEIGYDPATTDPETVAKAITKNSGFTAVVSRPEAH
jgi:copper chaperone CopZ